MSDDPQDFEDEDDEDGEEEEDEEPLEVRLERFRQYMLARGETPEYADGMVEASRRAHLRTQEEMQAECLLEEALNEALMHMEPSDVLLRLAIPYEEGEKDDKAKGEKA